MSKIKAKDLSYDQSLPPFLQRLHDQKAGRGDTDRHERPLARNMGKKGGNGDEDDGPTMVDESGCVVRKEEYAELEKKDADGSVKGEDVDDEGVVMAGALPAVVEEEGRIDGSITVGVMTKKRKMAKVVGDEAGGDEAGGDEAEAVEKTPAKPKGKKKVKAIKLAFDDAEDG
ncbi:hypothetical protein LTR56_019421 [Elasticomyces elasticus]|nr:hypothetical protein LTR56_019421 [Elasticomyces elasticus]KAK3635879.1 hypothetical protein LTR22_019014 [Elasticomyces elasticus]KAK4907317.1 hypothetical protein LTR49_023643 [Elasticomyces elasticus]KAK5747757.1 hypothetical protein LTS12_022199 [Elasticomyces elasticus]